MAYNSNIPQASNLLSASQVDLLGNFQSINTLISVDHATFGSANQGKHNQVTLPVQGSAPAPAGGDWSIFNFLYATTATNEIYSKNSAGKSIPFTASLLSTNATPPANNGMWTFLPSGILLKSGSNVGSTGLVTVTPTGGPAFTQILSVIVCPYSNTSTSDINFAVRLVDINSATTFRIYISSRTSTGAYVGASAGFQFLAIGY